MLENTGKRKDKTETFPKFSILVHTKVFVSHWNTRRFGPYLGNCRSLWESWDVSNPGDWGGGGGDEGLISEVLLGLSNPDSVSDANLCLRSLPKTIYLIF